MREPAVYLTSNDEIEDAVNRVIELAKREGAYVNIAMSHAINEEGTVQYSSAGNAPISMHPYVAQYVDYASDLIQLIDDPAEIDRVFSGHIRMLEDMYLDRVIEVRKNAN